MALRVGIAADERFLNHKTGHFHPEHPKRLDAVYRMVDRDFGAILSRITPEPAAMEEIERVHTPSHIKRIMMTASQRMSSLAPDTPVSSQTYLSAWLAVGACLQGIDALMAGAVDAFFALVRPPGHHALPDRACGFCIFNNIGIAARYAADRYALSRILIVDWDIHHGNGLNDLFYSEKGVFYFSTHDPMLYPYSGTAEQTGEDAGLGYTMNIPIDRSFTDNDMVYLYDQTLVSAITGYRPQLIMVAAGFDAHADDPIGRSRFSETLYGRITRRIMDARNKTGEAPPLFFSLEGGYHPLSLAKSVKSVLTALTDDRFDAPAPTEPGATVMQLAGYIRGIHEKYGVLK